jgi:SAM-dependent methyltransferase
MGATRCVEEEAAAGGTYDVLAPHYDAYTHHPAYAGWIRRLEELARRHGLRGRRALDIGCGTGKSLLPLIELGYEVTGCEPVEGMLAAAERKTRGRARLLQVAAADLPALGEFDYVTALNDVCNYIVHRDELRRAIAAAARNVRPGGLFVFDANTPAAYLGPFAETAWKEAEGHVFVWHGEGNGFEPGGIARAALEVFTASNGAWRRLSTHHVQRHHRPELLNEALEAAGLTALAIYGQCDDGRPEQPLDPGRHTKAIYVTGKPS